MLSGSFCFLEVPLGLDSRQRQKVPCQSGPVCSKWSASLTSSDPSNYRLPCPGHHQPFETDPEGWSLGPGQTWHWLPHQGSSGTRLWPCQGQTNVGSMEEAAGVKCTWIWDDRRQLLPLPPLSWKPKARKLGHFMQDIYFPEKWLLARPKNVLIPNAQ